MYLYWVETDDHCEDWFVVAITTYEAEILFEEQKEYEQHDAVAAEIMKVPERLNPEKGVCNNELLNLLGGVFLSSETPRIVRLDNKTYCEGLLEYLLREQDDDLSESNGEPRYNGTTRRPATDKLN